MDHDWKERKQAYAAALVASYNRMLASIHPGNQGQLYRHDEGGKTVWKTSKDDVYDKDHNLISRRLYRTRGMKRRQRLHPVYLERKRAAVA